MRRTWPECTAIMLVVLYAGFALSLGNAPLQDLPDHLTRAHILEDLIFNGGMRYGADFQFSPAFSPYLAGDLALSGLMWGFGTEWAARIWIALTLLLLPLSAWHVLRELDTNRLTALAGSLLGFYIATDYPFVEGFCNYQLSIACALFAYKYYLRFLRTGASTSYCSLVAWILCGYLLHLSALIFLLVLLGTTSGLLLLRRQITLGRTLLLLGFPCFLLALHLIFVHQSTNVSFWGTWYSKILLLGASAVRLKVLPFEMPLLLLFLATVLFPFFTQPRRIFTRYSDGSLLVVAFLGLYFLLPNTRDSVTQLDMRALPYALLCLIFIGAQGAAEKIRYASWQFAGAVALACLNLACLAAQMLPQNADLGRYKEVAALIPKSARVLPINTRAPIGRYRPFYHAGAYATLESGALTPYLFAADATASSIPYFSYLRRPPAPIEFWYEPGHYVLSAADTGGAFDATPQWDVVQQNFQYLLITKPWDLARIPIRFTEIAGNDVAALVRIDR